MWARALLDHPAADAVAFRIALTGGDVDDQQK